MARILSAADITLIVPVYNGGEAFRNCLTHIQALDPPPRQVIVVADGDTDGSRYLAQDFGVEVIALPTPRGPAAARNLAAHYALGDILFFVDADVALPTDALTKVTEVFQQELAPAALIGSYDDRSGASNFLSQYKNLLHHYVHQTSHAEASSFWGACGAIQRDAFWAVGGFDEGYRRPAIEDVELGYRLKAAGYRIRLFKSLQVKHLKRWTIFALLQTDFRQRALSWSRLLLQNERRGMQIENDLNLQMASQISVVLTYALLGALLLIPWWRSALILAVQNRYWSAVAKLACLLLLL